MKCLRRCSISGSSGDLEIPLLLVFYRCVYCFYMLYIVEYNSILFYIVVYMASLMFIYVSHSFTQIYVVEYMLYTV